MMFFTSSLFTRLHFGEDDTEHKATVLILVRTRKSVSECFPRALILLAHGSAHAAL